ncbi:MAG TPA: MBG domain-containing protein, partial [Gemmataceae bacterium]|nr:MBG domain-containing protein [Gemmataceae bacterium]
GPGDHTITGGGGSDSFFFSGSQLGSDLINEGRTNNTLNFYGFGAPVNLDLSAANTRVSPAGTDVFDQGPGNLTVSDPLAFTTVVGSPYGGTLRGNDAPNETLIGGGGLDSLVAGNGNDYLQGYFTQVVYLDFPAAGQTPAGDHVYTAAEQQAVLAGLQRIYGAFNYYFTLDPADAQTKAAVTGGTFATEVFDAPVVGGAADELDPKNLDVGGRALINITPFLGDAGAGLVPATSPNIINLTTTVAAHELGHLSGLTHLDAVGPIGAGLYSGMDPKAFFPVYTGPQDATETPFDVMASPASVGSTLLDAAGQTYLGERDAIKLAFNDTGTVLQQADLLTQGITVLDQAVTARVVGDLPALAVPNTLPAGVPGAGTPFDVTAVAVDGALQSPAAQDFYAIHGHAGEVLTLQVLSNYETKNPDPVLNPELAVFDAAGNTLAYNGNTTAQSPPFLTGAYNLHDSESPDPLLLDVTLPADGTYYVGVDSFGQGSAGSYQLFLYSFGTAAGSSGDTLVGGNGQDTFVGSSGNDLFTFQPNATGSATITGGSGSDVVDLSFDPAVQVSGTGSFTITPPLAIPTTASLTAPGITYGQHGLVTVTVGGGLYTPTGSVSLSVDGGPAVAEPLAGGLAAFDLGALGAGDHDLSVNYAAQGNFLATGAAGTLHVTPATLLVTPADASKVYGQANPSFAYAVTGFVNGEGPSVLSGSPSLTTPATAASPVGAYAITAA